MALPTFAVVDVETSGLNVRRHRILQLAVVTVDADGTVLDEWDSFVKLRWPLGRVGPTHIHGITRPMLKQAPQARRRARRTRPSGSATRCSSRTTRASTASSSSTPLDAARSTTSRPDTLERRLCTLRMSRRLDPERARSHRLADVCDRYGVTLDRPHEARSDALATAAVLPHLLRAHGRHRRRRSRTVPRPTAANRPVTRLTRVSS